MFEVCVWSDRKAAIESLSKSLIDKKIPVVDDIAFGCDSAESFKLSTILKNYSVKRSDALINEAMLAGHSVRAKDMKVRLAFSDTTASSVDAVDSAAAVAKANPVSTEQYVFVTSEAVSGADVVKFTGYTSHVVLEKIARPDSVIDKSPEKYASVCQIHAGPLKAFISAATTLLNDNMVTLKYLDAMTDPDTNTGIAAIAITSTMTFSEDDDGDTVSGGSIVPAVVVGFFAAKFNMNENPLKKMLPAPTVITAMNRGLKNKIKLLSRMGSETRLSCKTTDDLMAGELFSVDICATDKDGNLLTSTISSSKVADSQLVSCLSGKEILLDSVMLETALNACKGDLKIGLSLKKISLISDDAIVHAATKINGGMPMPVATEAAAAQAAPVVQVACEGSKVREGETVLPGDDLAISMEDAIADGLVSAEATEEDAGNVAETLAVLAGDAVLEGQIAGKGAIDQEEVVRLAATNKTPTDNITDRPLGKGKIDTDGGYIVITVSQFDELNNMLVFKDTSAKVIVRVEKGKSAEQPAPMPTRARSGQVVQVRRGSLRHILLDILETNKDTAMNIAAIMDAGTAVIPKDTLQSTVVTTLSVMYKDGLLSKPTRGRFQFDPGASYVLSS